MRQPSRISVLLQQATAAQLAGKVESAISQYQRILQLAPDYPSIPLVLGMLLTRAQRHGEAIPLLEHAARKAPDSVEACMALGNALAQAGNPPGAIAAFANAVTLAPDLAAAHLNLGNAQRQSGSHAEAIASYSRAIAIAPDLAQAHSSMGLALAELGDLDGAANALSAALRIQADYLPALNNLGALHLRQANNEGAFACFTALRRYAPAFPRAAYHQGVALQGLGREPDAAQAYRDALELDPQDLAALNNLCISLLRSGEAQQALEASDRYLERSPANRKPLAYKGAALVELGRRKEAAVLLDFERLILRRTLDTVDGFASVADFNYALAQRLHSHPTLRFEPSDKSTVGGSQTGELLDSGDPVFARMGRCIREAVAAYQAQVRTLLPAHPYVARLPERWRLGTWGVVLRNQGHQGPHFHPDGYISGVYYVQLPEDMANVDAAAGCIEFGRTAREFGGTQPPLFELLQPHAGLMLLFPSYMYHRTLAFESAQPRISIAFDVLPA